MVVKKKKLKSISKAKVYISSTYNNTVVTITDAKGGVVASASAGKLGFSGPKKATPYAAGVVVKNIYDKIKGLGIKEVEIFVKGIGTGRDAAVRAFTGLGFNITSIKDITPIPHNGCRPPRVRRV